MHDLLSKISSYNIFTNLFPGAVFCVIAENLQLIQNPEELISRLIWFYFIGMVLSRVGSIIMEPVLRRLRFIHYGSYEDYLLAVRKDPKLEIMVEVSNIYRTLATAFIALIFTSFFVRLARYLEITENMRDGLGLASLLILFLLSLRKQSDYINLRVKNQKDIEE